MKLLVIGQSVVDHLKIEGKKLIQPGGIFYTVSGLLSCINNNDEIFLCTSVEDKNYHLFSEIFDKVNKKFFQKVDSIPKVHLNLEGEKERHEKYENITDKLNVDFDNLDEYDGILINMITGFDIMLAQLKEIRKNYNGKIYFDVHTFSRGLGKNMDRNFRKIPQFDQWAECIDIIQVNRNELKTIADSRNEIDAANEVLNLSTSILIVTKEELGAEVYTKRNDEIISFFRPSLKVKVKNKVGCGDVFGAVFFYNYIMNNDLLSALKIANKAAGLTASYNGIDELKKLKDDLFSGHS